MSETTATKHTPGPWGIAPHSDGDEVLSVVADYQDLGNGQSRAHWIAECDASIDFGDDVDAALQVNEANARLIATAPELLGVLKLAQPDVCSLRCPSVWRTGEQQPHGDECKAISAVIARAEGRDV